MRICKYCNKPIEGETVFNLDKNGNGYHHSCLCELEFRTRDKRMYDKGRADALEQIREEIESQIKDDQQNATYQQAVNAGYLGALAIIDRYTGGADAKGEP